MKPGQEYGWDQYAELQAEVERLREGTEELIRELNEARLEIKRLKAKP